MKNIVLTGFMGTGKTVVSKIISKKLGYKLIDIDSIIEKEQNMTITDIFKHFGETKFREIESDVIKRISDIENAVISTGGGAVLKEENLNNLKKRGIIFCLSATPETILKRTINNNTRPLLQVENPLEKIKELLNIRRPFYEKADFIIDTENRSPFEIADEIIKKIKELD